MTERNVAVARTREKLREILKFWRAENSPIGLIPTMGALHDGHLTLVRRARARGERAVVSIFVNPTQFGPGEDFSAYPRREGEDLAKLAEEGVELVWMPDTTEMYPIGFATTVSVGKITADLEGKFRPGHFDGVATVVTKLFCQILPDSAYFGEKDYQQLQLVKRLVVDLEIPVHIEGVPTVRDSDGLALSSRNAYLSVEERRTAGALPRVLREIAEAPSPDEPTMRRLLASASQSLRAAGFDSVDYLTIRDAETLEPVTTEASGARPRCGQDRPHKVAGQCSADPPGPISLIGGLLRLRRGHAVRF